MAQLEHSFEDFGNKVDANWRAFYAERPPIGERQRTLFQLWLKRCGIGPAGKGTKKR